MIYAIPLLLKEKGASFKQIGLYSLSRYPFALMFLYGFIIDLYYIKKLGKTLTYIISLGYAFSIMMFVTSLVLQN